MSKSSMRIILVDPLGDILFSGESIAKDPPARDSCPETQRSATSDSGIFPVASLAGGNTAAGLPEKTGEIRSGRHRAA